MKDLFSPTLEQRAVAENLSNMRVLAFAGAGKTATLVYYATQHPIKRILYIAYNRSVKLEAIEKFKQAGCTNVRVETAHSLSYQQLQVWKHYDLTPSGNLKPHEIISLCGLDTGLYHENNHLLIAFHVEKLLSAYCNSAAKDMLEIDYLSTIDSPEARSFANEHFMDIYTFAKHLFDQMLQGLIPITHDAYLKFYQLKHEYLHYDVVMIDEAQDANEVILDIFMSQDHMTKILVGDRHQQIYRFRGAVNSLDMVNFPEFNLTESFRFDQEIANRAMFVLQMKKMFGLGESQRIIGSGGHVQSNCQAYISRSNMSLLSSAIDLMLDGGKRIHFEGNLSSYTYMSQGTSLYDVYYLKMRQKGKMRNPFLKTFADISALEEYIQISGDKDLSLILGIVNKYGYRLNDYLTRLNVQQVCKTDAEHIFSTCHKAKGQQYSNVIITDDFISRAKVEKAVLDSKKNGKNKLDVPGLTEEINLLYVALTRSSNTLEIPMSLTETLFEKDNQAA